MSITDDQPLTPERRSVLRDQVRLAHMTRRTYRRFAGKGLVPYDAPTPRRDESGAYVYSTQTWREESGTEIQRAYLDIDSGLMELFSPKAKLEGLELAPSGVAYLTPGQVQELLDFPGLRFREFGPVEEFDPEELPRKWHRAIYDAGLTL